MMGLHGYDLDKGGKRSLNVKYESISMSSKSPHQHVHFDSCPIHIQNFSTGILSHCKPV